MVNADAETIAAVSSGQVSISNKVRGGYEVYRGSKAALNTFMHSFAARHPTGRSVDRPPIRYSAGVETSRLRAFRSVKMVLTRLPVSTGRKAFICAPSASF
jgi:NAD(P)-dependent dehydrogenase (short-subunit alcohol dehydrogenase family)